MYHVSEVVMRIATTALFIKKLSHKVDLPNDNEISIIGVPTHKSKREISTFDKRNIYLFVVTRWDIGA
jgi:hypothetical protein